MAQRQSGTFAAGAGCSLMAPIIVIAASAGGLDPLRSIIAAIPRDCGASVFVVVHIGNNPSDLPTILSWSSGLEVSFANNGEAILPNHVYVAPPDRHMVLAPGRVLLNDGPKVHYTRPAADPLFVSAAEVYGERVIGVVLSGGDSDGAEGLKSIKAHGGTAIIQKPEEALNPSMPLTALATDHPDACLLVEEIAKVMAACAADVGMWRAGHHSAA
jgi:two-component system, chemotaxis family, protein-glutamate methylesterase/glutaminase